MTPEKIALGKQIFWDKRLSGDGSVACTAKRGSGYSNSSSTVMVQPGAAGSASAISPRR
jgi:cytochrome c peroxidase